MLEGARILITGGAGFIGSHLAERLLPHNEAVTVFDNLSRNALQASEASGHPRLRLIQGDVTDSEAVSKVVRGHNVVFHCAAIAGIDTVGRSPVGTLKVNILGSLNVLEASAKEDEMLRVVCFSTSEVYGRKANAASERADARVGPPGEPRWTYAAGKLAEEHLALAYHGEFGVPAVVLRPFNVYGPRQVGEGAIRSFILNALAEEPIEIRGDGTAVRAWTYINDMVDGACLAATVGAAVGQDFNIGNADEPISVADLAKRVVSLSASGSDIHFLPAVGVDVMERVPNIEKAASILGFAPRIHLDEGILATIEALRASR